MPRPPGQPIFTKKKILGATPVTGNWGLPEGTPPPPPAGGVTVDGLLVPDEGCWWGASTPAAAGQGTSQAGLDIWTSVTLRRPQLLRFYKNNAWSGVPTTAEVNLLEAPGEDRIIGVYSWKISNGEADEKTWAQIAAGALDARIATAANGIKTYPYAIFFSVYHEPEDNVNLTGGSGMTPTDYVAMWAHVRSIFDAQGVDNVVWFINYQGYFGWYDLVDDLYPGDSYIDWIFYDPYSRNPDDTTFEVVANRPHPSGGTGWTGFYDWAQSAHPTKPVGIAEWGIDFNEHTTTTAAALLNSVASVCETEFPALKAIMYWNQINVDDHRLQGRPTAVTNAARAYAAATYFNLASTADVP